MLLLPVQPTWRVAGSSTGGMRWSFFREGPAPRNDKARCEHTHTEHLPPLTKLQVVGEWVPNHPAMVDDEIHGVSVQDAEWEDARAMAEADPKVRAGYLTVGAIPWRAVPMDADSG
jgi:uncharacterized protein YciI